MWVADYGDDKLYAYRMSDKTRDAGKEFDTLSAAGNGAPYGIWSDSTTMWVGDYEDDKLYAYRMSDKARDAGNDFNTLRGAGNNDSAGIWSNGETMWVVDDSDDKVYFYNMSIPAPPGLRATAGNRQVALSWEDPDRSEITGYQYRVSDDDGNSWNPDWTPIPGSRTSTTSHTVRNLTNGVSYTFEIRARRNDLNGPAARVTATPLGPPSAPGTPGQSESCGPRRRTLRELGQPQAGQSRPGDLVFRALQDGRLFGLLVLCVPLQHGHQQAPTHNGTDEQTPLRGAGRCGEQDQHGQLCIRHRNAAGTSGAAATTATANAE